MSTAQLESAARKRRPSSSKFSVGKTPLVQLDPWFKTQSTLGGPALDIIVERVGGAIRAAKGTVPSGFDALARELIGAVTDPAERTANGFTLALKQATQKAQQAWGVRSIAADVLVRGPLTASWERGLAWAKRFNPDGSSRRH